MSEPGGAIAVILPNWIGDAVMATPALQMLRQWAGSQTRIEGFAPSGVCALLAGLPMVSALHEIPAARGLPLSRSFALAGRLKAPRFAHAVLLSNGLGVALAAWLAGIPRRAGYDRRGRGIFLTLALQPPRENGKLTPIPAIDYYLALVHALGAGEGRPSMMLATSAADEAAAEALWSVFDEGRARPTVILNNNAAQNPGKLWPIESMAALARQIAEGFDVNVMILGAPGHEGRASETAILAGHARIKAATPMGLGPLKACLRRASLVITTDSGVRSIAAAFGVPLVSLFGPTDPRWTILHVGNEIMIEEREQRRMVALPVERVWPAVHQQLARQQLERIRS
jgi:lipopolysaccharide heptosyltransferase II